MLTVNKNKIFCTALSLIQLGVPAVNRGSEFTASERIFFQFPKYIVSGLSAHQCFFTEISETNTVNRVDHNPSIAVITDVG